MLCDIQIAFPIDQNAQTQALGSFKAC
jgi:hypothetical protein